MSTALDISCPELTIVIDQGGTYVTTWTIPGSGALSGDFAFIIERQGDVDDVENVAGVITDANARKVQFTLPSTITETLTTTNRLRYSVAQTLGGLRYVIAKGTLSVRGTAL
jgi:hypothetical protein